MFVWRAKALTVHSLWFCMQREGAVDAGKSPASAHGSSSRARTRVEKRKEAEAAVSQVLDELLQSVCASGDVWAQARRRQQMYQTRLLPQQLPSVAVAHRVSLPSIVHPASEPIGRLCVAGGDGGVVAVSSGSNGFVALHTAARGLSSLAELFDAVTVTGAAPVSIGTACTVLQALLGEAPDTTLSPLFAGPSGAVADDNACTAFVGRARRRHCAALALLQSDVVCDASTGATYRAVWGRLVSLAISNPEAPLTRHAFVSAFRPQHPLDAALAASTAPSASLAFSPVPAPAPASDDAGAAWAAELSLASQLVSPSVSASEFEWCCSVFAAHQQRQPVSPVPPSVSLPQLPSPWVAACLCPAAVVAAVWDLDAEVVTLQQVRRYITDTLWLERQRAHGEGIDTSATSWTQQCATQPGLYLLGMTLCEFMRFRCDRDIGFTHQLHEARSSTVAAMPIAPAVIRRALFTSVATPRPMALVEELRTMFGTALAEACVERTVVATASADGVSGSPLPCSVALSKLLSVVSRSERGRALLEYPIHDHSACTESGATLLTALRQRHSEGATGVDWADDVSCVFAGAPWAAAGLLPVPAHEGSAPVRELLIDEAGARVLVLSMNGVCSVFDSCAGSLVHSFNVLPPTTLTGTVPTSFSETGSDFTVLSLPVHSRSSDTPCHGCLVLNLTPWSCGVVLREGWLSDTIAVLPCRAPAESGGSFVSVPLQAVLLLSDEQLLVAPQTGSSGRVLVFDACSGVALACLSTASNLPRSPLVVYEPRQRAIVAVCARQGSGCDVLLWAASAIAWVAATLRTLASDGDVCSSTLVRYECMRYSVWLGATRCVGLHCTCKPMVCVTRC